MPAPSPRLLETEDFEGRIEQALMAYEPVRSSLVPLQLEVDRSGHVHLQGWVRSRVIKDTIEDIVRRVPGVAALDLPLVIDSELEIKVARALATSPATASLEPGTVILRGYFGTMRLIGSVPTQALKDGVAQVTTRVDGVRRIENELKVVGAVGKQ
jgi:osmotically-inducible protein OsmY